MVSSESNKQIILGWCNGMIRLYCKKSKFPNQLELNTTAMNIPVEFGGHIADDSKVNQED